MSPGCRTEIIGQHQMLASALQEMLKVCYAFGHIDVNNLMKVIPRLLASSVNRCLRNVA